MFRGSVGHPFCLDMSRPEREDELGSKWSIEEVDDSGKYIPPETKSDDGKEEKTYFVLFTDTVKLQSNIQQYRSYLIKATTEEKFAKELHKLMQQEEIHKGTQVSFLNASDHDSDLYRMIFKCDKCAYCKFSITVDENKCHCHVNSEDFLSVEELLVSECKNCGSSSPDMRLNSKDSFRSCLEFQLICNNSNLSRTSTNAKICATTLDSHGRMIWKDEKLFAVCFHNMDGVLTENKHKRDNQILENNHENILAMMTGETQVIQILINQGVLSSDFEVDNLSRKDLIGKLLRHLLIFPGDVLPLFIDALRTTQLPLNLELADIFCKDK